MRDSVSELDPLVTKKQFPISDLFMKDKKTDKAVQTKKYIYLSDQ